MSLPEGVIAATALHHHLPLVTRNTSDFQSVPDMQIMDPFAP